MTDLTKAIELAEKASEQLQKSHVKQYTRSDGTVVQEHDDSRHPNIIGRATDHDTYNPKKASEFTFNGKRYSHTGTEGKSTHDGRYVSRFEHAESGHVVWHDDSGNVHADSKEEADRHHKRGMYAEHDDSRQASNKEFNHKMSLDSKHQQLKDAVDKYDKITVHNKHGYDSAQKALADYRKKKREEHESAPAAKKKPRLVPNPDVHKEVDGQMTIVGEQDKSNRIWTNR